MPDAHAPKALLLHGTSGSPHSFWLPSLGRHLQGCGFEVWAPQLPDADLPKLERQLPFLLEEGRARNVFGPGTVIAAHSAGCPLALALLEALPSAVCKTALVAGFLSAPPKLPHLAAILKPAYDWERIRANAGDLFIINSDNDPWGCDHHQGMAISQASGGSLILRRGEGHMGSETYGQPYPYFPLLERLLAP
ncbi:alpha/beta fold hydrolase [Paucidesulfovibrio longus]|uniref:alpha/beta fold hydrolase n=1 Tax=Paucidesulfovibrio longus TaxID=889 RepID=UPI000423A07C|nr:alpha/beta fold hydrolase [Paucidesulfovibrio longus]